MADRRKHAVGDDARMNVRGIAETKIADGPVAQGRAVEEQHVFILAIDRGQGADQFGRVGADPGHLLEDPPGVQGDSHPATFR